MSAVNLVIAVTDDDWFETLRSVSSLSEVNFWAPSGTGFKALQPGEMFLFKLHAPRNFIAGGGIFAYANTLPCSLAWEAFGNANGAHSLREMRARIAKYRKGDPKDRSDFEACRVRGMTHDAVAPELLAAAFLDFQIAGSCTLDLYRVCPTPQNAAE
jgi:putative restriction endonuclease